MDAESPSPPTMVLTGRPKSVSVDERQLRCGIELFHRALHGEERRLQNIDLVDLLFARERDAEAHGLFGNDIIQLPALFVRELFRVVEARDPDPRRQYDRRSAHRPRKRPAPGLVHAAHQLHAAGERFAFIDPQIDRFFVLHCASSGLSSVSLPSFPPR